jgi:hypothetical protein
MQSGAPRLDAEMTVERLRKEVARIPFWYHCLDLGGGILSLECEQTKWGVTGDSISLAPSLSGKSVLDIGAWDGFYSFEAERRGAERILATDSFARSGEYQPDGKAGFNLAHRVLGSRVEDMEIDVLDLSPELIGTFRPCAVSGSALPHASPAAGARAGCSRYEASADPRDSRRHARRRPVADGLLRGC